MRVTSEIRRPGSNLVLAVSVEVGENFPPLPTVSAAFAEQPGVLPVVAVDAHLHVGDRSGARPRDAADDCIARRKVSAFGRLGDERLDPLERDRLRCPSTSYRYLVVWK